MNGRKVLAALMALGVLAATMGGVSPAGAAPIGYWPFEDGLPVTADLGTAGNPGTLTNGPTYVAGAPGGSTPGLALNFNGSNQYVDMGNPGYPVANAITVSAWVNSATGSNGHIAAQGGGWGDPGYSLFWYGGSIRVELQRAGSKTTTDNSAPSTGAWHHVAFTWHQYTDSIDVYIDGALQGNQGTYTEPIGAPTMNLNVGRNQAHANYFSGDMDDVAIWDKWLGAAEIGQLAGGVSPLAIVTPTQPTPPPPPPPPPLGQWDFYPPGDLQSWTVLNGGEHFRAGDGDGMTPANSSGGFAHDGGHETFLVESPEFMLTGETVDGTNAMVWGSGGGAGDQNGAGMQFADPAAVLAYNGGNSNSTGQKGLAFYNVGTGMYDAVLFNQGNGGTDTYNLTTADLIAAGVDPTKAYRLHYYENDDGGWGWGQLNFVDIAVGPAREIPEPVTLALTGLAVSALGGYVRRRRRA